MAPSKISAKTRAIRESGLTLVELAFAIGILGVATLALLSVLLSSVQLDTLNRDRSWAREECRRQMERILALPFSQLARYSWDPTVNTFDVGFDVNGGAAEHLLPPRGQDHVGRITVEGVNVIDATGTATGDAVCYRVTVTATWRQNTGRGGSATGDVATYALVCNVANH